MHMIRHNNGRVQVVACVAIMQAGSQHNVASTLWQDRAAIGHEGDEMRLAVSLQVREFPAVEHGGIPKETGFRGQT